MGMGGENGFLLSGGMRDSKPRAPTRKPMSPRGSRRFSTLREPRFAVLLICFLSKISQFLG